MIIEISVSAELKSKFYWAFTFFFDEFVEFIVVSAYKEKRVSERMEENFLKGLNEADANGGKDLEGDPAVEHGVAGVGNFGVARGIGAGEGFEEEGEEELLKWEYVAGRAGFGEC